MSRVKNKKINLAVIFGGRSAEHEVSLVSAESVIKHLNKDKYNIIQIGIAKNGEWIVGPDAFKFLKYGQGKNFKRWAITPDVSLNKIAAKQIEVVFPVLHGTYGEDGTMQGLLELADLPYVGSGVLASAVAMDKITQKIICASENILMADWVWVAKKEWQWIKKNKVLFRKWLKGIEERFDYPLFVKPSNMGSSIGISKVNNKDELIKAVNLAARYDTRLIIEQGIEGARDVEVAVLGNYKAECSTVGEIISANEFYDYQAKYISGESQLVIPAKLPAEVVRDIKNIALQAYELLGCQGMARVDFLVRQDGDDWYLYLNELNTLPGFTHISMYPKLWQASGVSYSRLLDILIKLALERYREKKNLRTYYQPKTDWYNRV